MRFDEMVPYLQSGKCMTRPGTTRYVFLLPYVDALFSLDWKNDLKMPQQFIPTIQDVLANDWGVV